MPKASDIRPSKHTAFMFKGTYGFGKTLAAASFAKAGPLWLGYFDKQSPIELYTFFSRFGDAGKKILQNIDYDVYSAKNVHMYLNKIIDLSTRCDFNTVVTDSATNLTAAAVNWSLNWRDPKKKTDKLHKDAPAIVPDWDEYKVETSLVSQALDLSKAITANVIWTAHPLPTTKIEQQGVVVKVTKGNSIVTYGSKVAGMIPGNFTEIYHFSMNSGWNASLGKSVVQYIVDFQAVGDEFAKTGIFDETVRQIDITGKLFYDVWLDELTKQTERNRVLFNPTVTEIKDAVESEKPSFQSPFATQPQQTQWKT